MTTVLIGSHTIPLLVRIPVLVSCSLSFEDKAHRVSGRTGHLCRLIAIRSISVPSAGQFYFSKATSQTNSLVLFTL